MNDATPPPATPQKKFTLPKTVLVIWLAVFAFALYLAVSRHNLDSRALGELSGRFVARTLFALLLSWVAWRLSRRSDWVKSTVFLIVFLVFAADTIAGLGRRRERSDALDQFHDQVRAANQAQIDEFRKTGTITPNPAAKEQLISAMQDAASKGTDLERKLMAGMTEYIQKLNQGEALHTAAADKMDPEWILQPETPKTPQEIDTLATAVTNFVQANKSFLALTDNSTAMITQHLQAHGVPAEAIRGAIDGFRSGFKPQEPYIKKLRQQDAAYGQALLQILDLYKTEHGKWKWNQESELVAFENTAHNQRWVDLVDQIDQIATDQQKTQAALIDLRSKTIARPQ